jgi:HlyD family secretion protein
MSTQTIIERPLASGLSGGKSATRIKRSWKRVLSRRKPILIGITGFVILGMAAFYFWGNQTSATQYMTARVERGNLRNTVTATGTLQAVTTVQVGSQASGTISSLSADFNSKVRKGQVIAQLDPAVSKAQVDQARANLRQAIASLGLARAAVTN